MPVRAGRMSVIYRRLRAYLNGVGVSRLVSCSSAMPKLNSPIKLYFGASCQAFGKGEVKGHPLRHEPTVGKAAMTMWLRVPRAESASPLRAEDRTKRPGSAVAEAPEFCIVGSFRGGSCDLSRERTG